MSSDGPNSQPTPPKRRDSRIKQKDVPNPKSPGPKSKNDRLITEEVKVDHHENLGSIMNFWVQPSLKDAFVQACQFHRDGRLVPAEVLRNFMSQFVKDNPPDQSELSRQRTLRDQRSQGKS